MIHPSASIHPTAILGADPSIFPRKEDGSRPHKHTHDQGFQILQDVHIGALVIVVRGTTGSTIVGKGVRLLHRAHVGHDAKIGAHSLIGVGAVICGHATVGKRTTIATGALVNPLVNIGDDCYIAAGAVVVKDVPDNTKVIGVPAHHSATRNW